VLVRPARPEDAAALAEVHVRTWQAAYEHVFGRERLATLDLEERRARWEARLAAAEPQFWPFVAEDETGRVVGFATTGASRDVVGEGEGELYAIYALPEAWGTGAGRALLAAVLGALRDAGFLTASLWVLEDNPRARRFYEREGWSLDGGRRKEDFLGVPITEVRYRITLG
jgi:GNAT superfamily N-acetyltransferase